MSPFSIVVLKGDIWLLLKIPFSQMSSKELFTLALCVRLTGVYLMVVFIL